MWGHRTDHRIEMIFSVRRGTKATIFRRIPTAPASHCITMIQKAKTLFPPPPSLSETDRTPRHRDSDLKDTHPKNVASSMKAVKSRT